MSEETGLSVLLCTAPSVEVAARIGRTLVEERLVACANLVPGLRSLYAWKGEICDEPEVLLLLKARTEAFEAVRARIVALHPYEVPEVIRLDVTAAHAPYLAWAMDATRR